MNTELGHFYPFTSPGDLDKRRQHRPTTLHTRRPGRCATSERSCRPNFKANRLQTCPNWASEAATAATVGHRAFLDFLANPYHISTIFGPLNSFPWSLFADSSPFERYDKNKVGRLLDRVFRPPQQPLDQGEGTDEFLVSWAFH